MTKSNWGGTRPGAGRKPSKEKRRPYSFRLTLAEHKVVKEFIKKMKEENKMKESKKLEFSKEIVRERDELSHEDMMEKAWKFIEDVGITDDENVHAEDPDNRYLVENVHAVRDAYYSDLEDGLDIEEEDVCGFLDRHGIKWQ